MKNTIKKISSNSSLGLPLTVLIIIIALSMWGKKLFNLLFNSEPNAEEQNQLNAVNAISINANELTITENDALQRANNIYNAMSSIGTDEMAIVKNLTKTQYQDSVRQYFAAVSIVGSDSSLMSVWQQYENHLALSKADYELIAQKFGLKAMGWGQGNATMLAYINYEDSGQLNQLVQYIYSKTQIRA